MWFYPWMKVFHIFRFKKKIFSIVHFFKKQICCIFKKYSYLIVCLFLHIYIYIYIPIFLVPWHLLPSPLSLWPIRSLFTYLFTSLPICLFIHHLLALSTHHFLPTCVVYLLFITCLCHLLVVCLCLLICALLIQVFAEVVALCSLLVHHLFPYLSLLFAWYYPFTCLCKF